MSAISDTPPFFREQELGRILTVVLARRPALIVLIGAPGMGKSGVLAALRDRAAAHGWAIAGSDATRKLGVDPRLTPDLFRERLMDTFSEPPAPNARASVLAAPSPLAQRPPAVDAEPVVAELAHLSKGDPVLVIIDDFRPSAVFGSWFERRFIPALLGSGFPISVAIAERAGSADVRASATEVIELGPLAPELVRNSLAGLSPKLDPPLSDRELTVYEREARSPVLLDSLLRALALAEAPTPST